MVDNELITKVRSRNVKSILSNVFTSSGGGAALTDGNGTTANGSAVDLGGTITSNTTLNLSAPAGTDKSLEINTINGVDNINFAIISYDSADDRNVLSVSYSDILSFRFGDEGLGPLIKLASSGGNFSIDLTGIKLDLSSDATGDTYHRNSSGYLTRRGVITATSTATLTPNSDTTYQSCLTAQAEALTIANPTGTPFNGQDLVVRVKDNGTARAITFGDQFRAIGTALPTTTTAGKVLYICSLWNAAESKWDTVNHLEV